MVPGIAVQGIGHVASLIITFAILSAMSGVIAFVAASVFGGESSRERRAVFSVVGFVCLFASATFVLARMLGKA